MATMLHLVELSGGRVPTLMRSKERSRAFPAGGERRFRTGCRLPTGENSCAPLSSLIAAHGGSDLVS